MSSAPGLLFKEVMAGGFALGETDPVAGERAGGATHLTMRARVTISDLARFRTDADHTCALDGTVDFAPIGTDLRADHGVAKLFAPTNDPNLKLMVYRLIFRQRDAEYCLDGAKHVRRHSVLHAWRDTTTLFCRLHEGATPAGAVIGAGTLHLTPLAFARQLTTFRTSGAPSIGARISTLAGFMGFFTRETLDTYFRRAQTG